MPEGKSGRREIRILCRINVIFKLNFECFYGTAQNLGLHGMFIGFDGDVPEGEQIELNFMIAAEGSALVEAWGRVVWVNRGPDRNPDVPEGFGVEFGGMTDESRQLISNFINQCTSYESSVPGRRKQ